jgi:hypothetical protein
LQHIANNLLEAFTNYKGVTKSSYPTRIAPERAKIPIKTIQLSLPKKRGRSTAAPKDNAPTKCLRILRTKSSKSVNPSQPQVGRHPIVDKNPKPEPNPQLVLTLHPNSDPRTSKHPDSIILGNDESINGVKKLHRLYQF